MKVVLPTKILTDISAIFLILQYRFQRLVTQNWVGRQIEFIDIDMQGAAMTV